MSLIILDRDGVINEDSDSFIKSAEEWLPIPGSLDAIAMFNHAGYHVAVATNQSGIGRGLYGLETLHDMHKKMAAMLDAIGGSVDAVFYCPHLPAKHCSCRKPKPGMLLDIAKRFKYESLQGIYFVGDTYRDVEAARAAGATPVLVRTGKGVRTLQVCTDEQLDGVLVFDNLLSVANELLVNK